MLIKVGFNFCNTSLGHDGGDEALKHFSGQFKALVESSEFAQWDNCRVFHNGGDEYAILCQPPDQDALKSLMQKLGAIEFNKAAGTEPGYENESVTSWTRAGAVMRKVTNQQQIDECVKDADSLEGMVSEHINLPRGKPASARPTVLAELGSGERAYGYDGGNYRIWTKEDKRVHETEPPRVTVAMVSLP